MIKGWGGGALLSGMGTSDVTLCRLEWRGVIAQPSSNILSFLGAFERKWRYFLFGHEPHRAASGINCQADKKLGYAAVKRTNEWRRLCLASKKLHKFML